LGRSIKDWDLATDAVPDDVIRMLKSQSFINNIIETGKSFGVINALTDNDEYEIATFRIDSSSGDGRRPNSVTFSDIATDVKRRDLTIEDAIQKMGYDGVIIKGREMVVYNTEGLDIRYYKDEEQVQGYYELHVLGD